jgi:hypothetical protein
MVLRCLAICGLILAPAPTAVSFAGGPSRAPVFFIGQPPSPFIVQCWTKQYATGGILNCRNAKGNTVLFASRVGPKGYDRFDPRILPKTAGVFLKGGSVWTGVGVHCSVTTWEVHCTNATGKAFTMRRKSYLLR